MGAIRDTLIIEDGPDREMLIDAFKYAYDEEANSSINFILVGNSSFKDYDHIKISGLDHEKGDGHSFIIRGYIYLRQGSSSESRQFIACYDTRTRKGRALISR